MEHFVDNLMEDEAEKNSLLAKPACFVIFGKPGVGKSTLAKNLAESWKCILVDDTDLLNTHIQNKTKEGEELLQILSEGRSIPEKKVLELILAKLNSPDLEHYGYVLSCLPFVSEEGLNIHKQIQQIKNLKLPPDFIINIKCPDEDLVHRLTGLKQHPDTGQVYNRDQWSNEEKYDQKKEVQDESTEDEEEQTEEEELTKDFIEELVLPAESFARNVIDRINAYKDTILRPLEIFMANHNPLYLMQLDGNNSPEELTSSVMSHLGSLAIARVPIPVLLHQPDDDDLPEDIGAEELLDFMSTAKLVSPGFRWRRSRWGRACPVALKEGNIIQGKSEFTVGFRDKLYILSSEEAYYKFVANPRQYLLPPMPRPPCKVFIVGPPLAGKSTICRLLAQHYNAVVLDMEAVTQTMQAMQAEAEAEAEAAAAAAAEQERLDEQEWIDLNEIPKSEEDAMEEIEMETAQDSGQNPVTENPPEALMAEHGATEEANERVASPDPYIEALWKRVKEIEEMESDAGCRTGWVLDNFPESVSQMEALHQTGIIPDNIFRLTDTDGHEVLRRIYLTNEENINERRFHRKQSQKEEEAEVVLEQESEAPSTREEEDEALDEQSEVEEQAVPWEQESEEQSTNEETINKAIESRLQEEHSLEEEQAVPGEQESEVQSTNEESIDKAMEETLKDQESQEEEQAVPSEQESELWSNLKTAVEGTDAQAVALQEQWEFGYPEGPEMNEYIAQLQQLQGEWDQIEAVSEVSSTVLEIGGKSPDALLQEIIQHMDKPFKFTSWEITPEDLDEEADDFEAMVEPDKSEESSNDSMEDEDEGDINTKRMFGDSKNFCPVAFKTRNVLWPCVEDFAAKYRERIFYFSSDESRDSFIQNPKEFISQTAPLKPPSLRIFMIGNRGSGKTTHGVWLARQLGLFHIEFREQMQNIIIAKTKKSVPYYDEVVSLEDESDDLDLQIAEALGEEEKEIEQEMEDTDELDLDMEVENILTEEEMSIETYLTGKEPLDPEILDVELALYWKEEPYRSTGFILEGFPRDPTEVQYMMEQQLFPDVVVVMEVDVIDVQERLLPKFLDNWHERRKKREEKLKLLRDIANKKREEKIAKRREELMAEQSLKEEAEVEEADVEEGDEEADGADNEDDIEALLEDEFPPEEDDDMENEETEETASEKLELEIEERFVTDESNLTALLEALSEHNIPRVTINTSQNLQISQTNLLQKIQPLSTNRESLFQKCLPISSSVAQNLLDSSYKMHSAFGCRDPVAEYKKGDLMHPLQWPISATYPVLFHHYIYLFASKENRKAFMHNPLKYLHQPKPARPLPIKIAVIGPPKSGKTTVAQTFSVKYGLARLSIGEAMRTVLRVQENSHLAVQVKSYLLKGLVVPDELAIRCLEVALMSSACISRGYVLDGFPMTLKQAELMESLSIIPMLVVELELDIAEIQSRRHAEKCNRDELYVKHDSTEIIHIYNSTYHEEVVPVRQHFQQQYQNHVLLDGTRSKWSIWGTILKEASVSLKFVQTYREKLQNERAARIHKLCVTPKEFQSHLGEFGQYCPVCLALHRHLVDCSETALLTHTAQYKRRYYKMCGELHLEKFLSTPVQFVAPSCPRMLPPAHMLPRKLTEIQVKERFPRQVELQGFCPVTYQDGKQRYEALVRGKQEYAVEYREQIYIFESKEKQYKFLRTPDAYWDQKLPKKVPPLSEPVPLPSLPTLGYLEQGVAVAVIKAMTAVGCLKPKYPFISVQRSALIYLAFYLKAFNHKSTDHTRQKYIKKLALFEESCTLIPYLSSTMTARYKPPSERPVDFEFKMKRFMALGESPGAASTP